MRTPFLCSQGVQNEGATVYDCVVHKTWEQSQFTAYRYPFMKAKVKPYITLPLHYTLAGCLRLVVSGWLSPAGCLWLVVSGWLSPAGCLRLVVSGWLSPAALTWFLCSGWLFTCVTRASEWHQLQWPWLPFFCAQKIWECHRVWCFR